MGFWSKLKRAVRRVVKAVVRGVQEIVSRILKLGNAILTYFGILPIKQLKLRILILRNEQGNPVAGPADVLRIVEKAKQILRGSARISVVPTDGKDFVWTVNEFAPAAALHLKGDGFDLVKAQLGEAGDFFDEMIGKYHSKATFPWNFPTTPITGFVVAKIDGRTGVASPIAGNWFAIDPSAFAPVTTGDGIDTVSTTTDSSIIAHELGHNMGWFSHRDEAQNLMHQDDSRGYLLTQWQLVVMRSSGCVSIW